MLVEATRSAFVKGIFFVFFFSYLLAPTLDLGIGTLNLGLLSISIVFTLSIINNMFGNESFFTLNTKLFFVILGCLFLGLYSHMLFYMHGGNYSTSYLDTFIKMILYLASGYFLVNLTLKRWESYSEFVENMIFLSILVAFANSIVILLQYFFPEFRIVTNSFFIMGDSNINFLIDETRFKGIANGGGASLSVFMGLAAVFSIIFYLQKKFSLIWFSVIFFTISTALIYVGRTGIFIILFGFVLVFFRSLFLSDNKIRSFLLAVFVFGLLCLGGFIALEFLPRYFIERYFFFLSGSSGLRNEGTIEILRNMLTLPDTLKQFFFGTGSASGSFLTGQSADIGYMKTATMFGIPTSFLLYAMIFFTAVLATRAMGKSKIYMLIIIMVLAIVEIKEPFLFKGPSARFFYFLLGAYFCCKYFKIRQLEQ